VKLFKAELIGAIWHRRLYFYFYRARIESLLKILRFCLFAQNRDFHFYGARTEASFDSFKVKNCRTAPCFLMVFSFRGEAFCKGKFCRTAPCFFKFFAEKPFSRKFFRGGASFFKMFAKAAGNFFAEKPFFKEIFSRRSLFF